jgi:hypothetical protein
MSKDLAKKETTEVTDFACLTPEISGKFAAILKENLGAGGISQGELTRIKVPAGGGTSWTVPSITGDESVKTITGIIVHFADVRGFWPEKFTGEGNPPNCSSTDGIVGMGDPGGMCATCPMNQFGTGTDAAGKPSDSKACREGRLLFVLREADVIPIIVSLSTMSVKPSKQYFLQLAQAPIPFYGCVSEIGLEATKNKTGITYSRATFKAVRRLTDDQINSVRDTMKNMAAVFGKATTVEHEDLAGK